MADETEKDNKINAFLKSLKSHKVHWYHGSEKKGWIETNGLCFSFSITSSGYIDTKIEVKYPFTYGGLGTFEKMIKNKLND